MMRLREILHLVLINIVENRSRMMMTSLGIVVGAATIVLVIAVGQGGQADVADQFKNLNAGAIEVRVGTGADAEEMSGMMQFELPEGALALPSGGSFAPSGGFSMAAPSGGPGMGGGSFSSDGRGGSASRSKSQTRLTTQDVEDLKQLVPNLQEVTILQSGETEVFGGVLEESANATVVGALAGYAQVSNLEVRCGRFLSEEDEAYRDYVAVIGSNLAEEVFGGAAYALGDFLEIEGKNYEIVGVLEKIGSVTTGISPDDAVYIPYSTAEKYVFGAEAEPTIAAVASTVDAVAQCMADIETVLKENYPNAFFDVTDAGSAMAAASASADTLAMLLFAVASIVFVVGGIGIMNVLFASVQERTQEIGILRAIGCARRAILVQFLLEANLISLFGGLVGVGASFALMPVVEMLGVRCVPSAWGAVLAFVFALLTGSVFGFYPAWKASRLAPIEALNLN
jgi:putative ABC transport system permease protein